MLQSSFHLNRTRFKSIQSQPPKNISSLPMHRPPEVAIVDFGPVKTCDADGDGIPDFDHAELIERLIKSYCPSAKTTRIYYDQPPYGTSAQVFRKIAKEAQTGRHHYDAVTCSLSAPYSYQNISTGSSPALSPSNINAYRGALYQFLKASSDPDAQDVANTIDEIEKVSDAGIPVYISAGNEGPLNFNLYNLARGTWQVGAQKPTGETEPYSVENALINRHEQGGFLVTKVKGGYDLNADGRLDILDSEVSGGEQIVKRFVGKDAKAVIADESVIQEIKQGKKDTSQYLFSVDDLLSNGAMTPEMAAEIKHFGAYVFMHPKTNALFPGFRVKNGKIIYSPDGAEIPNAVQYLYGTSLSAPKCAAVDLQNRLDDINIVA